MKHFNPSKNSLGTLARLRAQFNVIFQFWFSSACPQCYHTSGVQCECNHLGAAAQWKNCLVILLEIVIALNGQKNTKKFPEQKN